MLFCAFSDLTRSNLHQLLFLLCLFVSKGVVDPGVIFTLLLFSQSLERMVFHRASTIAVPRLAMACVTVLGALTPAPPVFANAATLPCAWPPSVQRHKVAAILIQ